MIESANFWFKQFAHIRTNSTVESNRANMISDTRAAQNLITVVFPQLNPAIVLRFLEEKTIPNINDNKSYFIQDIDRVASNFSDSGIEPSATDILAIIFETTGKLVAENTGIDGLEREQTDRLLAYRTLYPAARLSIAMTDHDAAINTKTQHCLEVIEKAAQEQKNDLKNLTHDSIKEKYLEALEELDKKANDISEKIGSERNNFDETVKNKSNSLVDKTVNSIEERVANKIKALTNDLILKDAIDMWWWKAFWHKIAFWLSAIVFVALVVAPLWIGWTNWSTVQTEIEELFPIGEILPFGRILVVTVPLLGYAWVLRLISKYLNQHLTLGNDASQRRVMARTFVQLVSEGAAKDDQDRATILQALFRPMPGATSDDDQPPNVIGMIKKEILPKNTT
ncbi:hypothetical protein [Roseibium album]|uniref:hypothetical protein n=1 Tax=Roseibium album TaxID=311410 RepID=UPI00249210BD|nr:hypothetical protein [Roseibium album]